MTHTNDPICPGCTTKLLGADPYLAWWFNECVKPNHLDCHVSWAYRNQQEQEACFISKASPYHYPDSKHNFTLDGKPCAKALDLFQINALYTGGLWDPMFCAKLDSENVAANRPIKWGGNFKKRKDNDHFEID